jgi:hypothetical protein
MQRMIIGYLTKFKEFKFFGVKISNLCEEKLEKNVLPWEGSASAIVVM